MLEETDQEMIGLMVVSQEKYEMSKHQTCSKQNLGLCAFMHT
jgi:hypothetical protein